MVKDYIGNVFEEIFCGQIEEFSSIILGLTK